MTESQAEKYVVISALVVFGVYFYRHLTEGTGQSTAGTEDSCTGSALVAKAGASNSTAQQLIGFGTPAQVGKFITAWGFVYFVIAIITTAAPGFGASLAILVAVSDFLANSCQVAHDVTSKLSTPDTTSTSAGTTVATTAPSTTSTLTASPPVFLPPAGIAGSLSPTPAIQLPQ